MASEVLRLDRLLAVLLIAVVAKYTVQFIRHRYLARKWHTEPIVNSRSILGMLPELFDHQRDTAQGFLLERMLDRFERTQANTLSMAIPSSTGQLILTMSPDNMKAMLSTQFNEFSIGVRKQAFGPLLGNGIFASEGHHWKHSRTLLKPQFAREQVAHVQMLEPHVQILAKHIRKNAGRFFDIQSLFHRFTLDAGTHFLFGESVNDLKDETVGYNPDDYYIEGRDEFNTALTFVQSYLVKRSSLFNFYWIASSKQFRDSVRHIHDYTNHFVNKALQLKPEEIEARSREGYTFLYELVKDTRNPVDIRDQLLNIMLAGRSTTASLLSSAMSELSRHPDVWRKLREEVIMQFGTGESPEELESITFESLKKCNYLKWVINETLRVYPPVSSNLREALKDTTLPSGGGKDGRAPIFVPKGAVVIFSIYCVQRSKKHYGPDADEFRPERWANLNKIGWAFMPFGSGPRICLGQQFALTEASYVLVRLAQMFHTLETAGGEYPARKQANATLRYTDGVNVRMA
ncbi:hypothetical protein ACI3LY_001384 [Candidozyma auris]|uniref:Cytochrome P450 n=2 Tax=Candidozyma auris TaxID=498019 RepID=A0A2H0ZI96_CANAR|nr:hypothetical protein QG37_04140 [[Candida] auris]PIS50346.1 hypothetical protein B9J08_004161 [[Candida] auris]QWW25401.1 hypothetical protein CA7LBN_004288 [[Candida] auris]